MPDVQLKRFPTTVDQTMLCVPDVERPVTLSVVLLSTTPRSEERVATAFDAATTVLEEIPIPGRWSVVAVINFGYVRTGLKAPLSFVIVKTLVPGVPNGSGDCKIFKYEKLMAALADT